MKNIQEFVWKKSREWASQHGKKDKTERAMAVDRRTRGVS